MGKINTSMVGTAIILYWSILPIVFYA